MLSTIAAAFLLGSHAVTAQWISGSVTQQSWVNAVNRKRCLHNTTANTLGRVEWHDDLYQMAKAAAVANSICSSSDISYIYLQNATAYSNYAGFSFHIEPGVSGRDTAIKVVDAWYSGGLAECSGATGSGLKLPGCVENDGGTFAPTAAPTTAAAAAAAADVVDSTDTTEDDIQYVFMAMVSKSTKYMGCYRCDEGAASPSAASATSIRVICTFKGVSDACSNSSDCSTCYDWEATTCHEQNIPAVNPEVTAAGDCTAQIFFAGAVQSLPSNATIDSNDGLGEDAIILISVAVVIFVLIVILVVCKWEWIRVHVLGRHSRRYIDNRKAAQKASSASVQATMRSVKEVRSKRANASIRHPTTDEIFNPRFGLQETGKSATGKSVSALDHLDRFEARARGQGPDGTGLVNRGGRARGVSAVGDAAIGDATF